MTSSTYQNDLILKCSSESECNDFFKLINSYLNGSKNDCIPFGACFLFL